MTLPRAFCAASGTPLPVAREGNFTLDREREDNFTAGGRGPGAGGRSGAGQARQAGTNSTSESTVTFSRDGAVTTPV